MKVSIYIEQGITQLVLTPETEWEKSVTRVVSDGQQSVTIKRGGFYHCQGGWVRENGDADSLILVAEVRSKDEFGIDVTA